MPQNDRNLAVEILKGALALAWLPFSWSAHALRRSRVAIADPAQSAELAKFDTRSWNTALLRHLDWRRFEELCAAFYEPPPTVLVRCKPWDAHRVGIKPLRELRAAMAAAGVDEGVLVSPSRFTLEAAGFAAKESITLVDGPAFLEMLRALAPEKSLALLKLATQGDFLTPTCPACAIKMTSRKSTQGGRKFWGCVNYPKCKQTFSGSAPA